jgi:hypothetical protein
MIIDQATKDTNPAVPHLIQQRVSVWIALTVAPYGFHEKASQEVRFTDILFSF